MDSGYTGPGPKCEELIDLLSYDTSPILTNSCTSAIQLALATLGIGPGDRVAVSPFTMIATVAAIVERGAEPYWIDVDANSVLMNMSAARIAARDPDNRIKAIIVTAVGGMLPEQLLIDRSIGAITNYEAPIIIDAAQGIGSKFYLTDQGWRDISTMAHFVCISFQSIKSHTCGDGGALYCMYENQRQLAKRLSWFGMSRDVPENMTRLEWQMTQDIPTLGFKCHMNDIQAAILLDNFGQAEERLVSQKEFGEYLFVHLGDIGHRFNENAPIFTTLHGGGEPSYWVFPLIPDDKQLFTEYMNDRGFQVSSLWKPCYDYSCFDEITPDEKRQRFPNVEYVRDHVVFISLASHINRRKMEIALASYLLPSFDFRRSAHPVSHARETYWQIR